MNFNECLFFSLFFSSPPLSAHLDEISSSAHSNRAGHYRRIVIIFFSLCLLCGKHSWFCCCNTDPKRKKKKKKKHKEIISPKTDCTSLVVSYLRGGTQILKRVDVFFSSFCVKASVLIIFLSQRNGDGHVPLDVRWKCIVSLHSNEIFTLGHKKPSVMCFLKYISWPFPLLY